MGRVVGGGGGGAQPWDRPPALQGKRGGVDCSRGIAHRRRRRGGKVERSRGIAHWRSRGRVEGRRAAVGRPTGAAKEGRCVRGRVKVKVSCSGDLRTPAYQ